MSKQYVLTISRRDPEHPLKDDMLIEAGNSDVAHFVEAIAALVDMLRVLKTPEKVAQFMRHNAAKAKAHNLVLAPEASLTLADLLCSNQER